MSETPVYTTRMSVEAAAEERQRATAEAMKDLAATLNNPESDQMSDCSSDCSDSSHIDEALLVARHKRARSSTVQYDNPRALITGLERRLHYLQLELTNKLVDLDDKELELAAAVDWIKTVRAVNNEVGFLRGAVQRGFVADARYVTAVQMEQRLKLFREETSEHASLCASAINKIDLDEIKQGLTRVLVAERKKLTTLDRNYSYQIMRTRCVEVIQRLTFYSAVFFVVFAVLYNLIFTQ